MPFWSLSPWRHELIIPVKATRRVWRGLTLWEGWSSGPHVSAEPPDMCLICLQLSSLRFASRMKLVTTEPAINEKYDAEVLRGWWECYLWVCSLYVCCHVWVSAGGHEGSQTCVVSFLLSLKFCLESWVDSFPFCDKPVSLRVLGDPAKLPQTWEGRQSTTQLTGGGPGTWVSQDSPGDFFRAESAFSLSCLPVTIEHIYFVCVYMCLHVWAHEWRSKDNL